MYKLLKHLKHLLTATNEHGAHSPFIYNYLTKGIYPRNSYHSDKTINVLLKSIVYFKISSIFLQVDEKSIENEIVKKNSELIFDTSPYDLVFIDTAEIDVLEISKTFKNCHNNSVVLVNNIHESKKTEIAWNKLTALLEITVSIDFFSCGLLFFRKEQAKEHFKFRL